MSQTKEQYEAKLAELTDAIGDATKRLKDANQVVAERRAELRHANKEYDRFLASAERAKVATWAGGDVW